MEVEGCIGNLVGLNDNEGKKAETTIDFHIRNEQDLGHRPLSIKLLF